MRPLRLDLARFHRVPRTDHCGLHRRRLLRPGRTHRFRQVHRARRDLLRPVRHGAALGRPAPHRQRAGAVGERGPGAPGLRGVRGAVRGHPGGPPRRQGQGLHRRTPGSSSCRPASTCGCSTPPRPSAATAGHGAGRHPGRDGRAVAGRGRAALRAVHQLRVLPQGEFARFLHAKPAERQEILVNLLGLRVYQRIGERAGRASARPRPTASATRSLLGDLDRGRRRGAGRGRAGGGRRQGDGRPGRGRAARADRGDRGRREGARATGPGRARAAALAGWCRRPDWPRPGTSRRRPRDAAEKANVPCTPPRTARRRSGPSWPPPATTPR